MNFNLDTSLAENYKSNSQKIRVMGESWVGNNIFCPICGNSHIYNLNNNMPVADLKCDNCGEIYELKSKQGKIGIITNFTISTSESALVISTNFFCISF